MGVSEREFKELKERVLAEVDLTRELSDEEICLLIEKYVEDYSHIHALTLKERELL